MKNVQVGQKILVGMREEEDFDPITATVAGVAGRYIKLKMKDKPIAWWFLQTAVEVLEEALENNNEPS